MHSGATCSCCRRPRRSGQICLSPKLRSGCRTISGFTRHSPPVGTLEPSTLATSMRNTGRGSAIVTDGPFTEAAEQIVGFYLIDSSDEADLLEITRSFAEGGDHVEVRRVARD